MNITQMSDTKNFDFEKSKIYSIISHNDPDGWTSMAVFYDSYRKNFLHYIYPNLFLSFDNSNNIIPKEKDFIFKFYLVDYSDKEEIIDILSHSHVVFMFDFSVQPLSEMFETLKNNKLLERFVWIDHHKTSIEEFNQIKKKYQSFISRKCDILLKEGIGACWLTYCKFNPKVLTSPEKPLGLEYIAKYDVWDIYNKEQFYLIAYMQRYKKDILFPNDPSTYWFWKQILSIDRTSQFNKIINKGKIIHETWLYNGVNIIYDIGFECEIEGYKALCVNSKGLNSLPFEKYEQIYNKSYDIWCSFFWTGNVWTVSLYSKKVDVGSIAKKMGGGGHKNAAGFQCDHKILNKFFKM